MPGTIRFGCIDVNPATRQIRVDGVPAALGARAFDMLLALIERRERVVPQHELMAIVWPQLVVEPANLHVQVSGLRKLLGPQAITTIPGRGYRFVAALAGEPALETPVLPAPQAVPGPGNVPVGVTALVGRDAELQTLQAQIQAHRLVTIVGASGMGKTALALAVAAAQHEHWRDGVWFVELASVSDPTQLPQAVALALRISLPQPASEAAALDHLVGVLGSLSMLLVLDNCEHLVEAAGALATRLLAQTGGVRVLATSQELLNVAGEALHKLLPLEVPAEHAEAQNGAGHSAIELFCERARAADPGFALTRHNAQAVADICRRLDGLPLAIELAAARVRLLGVQGLRDRLGERFRVLTGGARSAMRRHQTLQAALDWSHALLSGPEQVVFRRLGVFVGGFSLDLVQALASDASIDEWAVLDALGGLVDKSLVIADASDRPRYRLLETTRAHALGKLAEAGETDAFITRHAQVLCRFFERADEARLGEQPSLSNLDFVRLTAPELDNARVALDWAGSEGGESAGDLNLAVGLAGSASRLYASLGLEAEAVQQLTALCDRLDQAGGQAGADTVEPARAARLWASLAQLGVTFSRPVALSLQLAARAEAFFRTAAQMKRLFGTLTLQAQLLAATGQWHDGQRRLDEACSLEAADWPASRIGERLAAQGWIHLVQGQFEQALAVHREQRALLAAVPGERRGLIFSENNLCRVLLLLQRHDECIDVATGVIEREARADLGPVGPTRLLLLVAQLASGRIAEAGQTLASALPGWRRSGTVRVASSAMAVLLAEQGKWAAAARVGGAALAHARRAGFERHPSFERLHQRLQALLRTAPCTRAELERWQVEGQALNDAAIEAICLRMLGPMDEAMTSQHL